MLTTTTDSVRPTTPDHQLPQEQTRKEKTEAVEILHAQIDQLEASLAKLTEDSSVVEHLKRVLLRFR